MNNVLKIKRYLKRNGFKNTYYAAKERLLETRDVPYNYVMPEEGKLIQQSMAAKNPPVLVSIVVPVYETPERYLRELVDSVVCQSYPRWELILADASKTDNPFRIISGYKDDRIKYVKLSGNNGISENTNEAIRHANGDYIALLDHDDLLTPDAIFEVATSIIKSKAKGIEPVFIYSDEDKCDGDGKRYYEPNIKPEFNFDYLLSNNYICHLSTFKKDVFERYSFRKEYDGAQDHDIILRVTGDLALNGEEEKIIHIPKVLYHWRCHEASTALNTDSKNYAYEAGLKCVEDYTGVETSHTLHKGFYHPEYGCRIFEIRKDIGAVGGFVTSNNKITGGIYNAEGICEYLNMDKHFSGYLHRAHCLQDVYALDLRTLTPSKEFSLIYAEMFMNMDKEMIEARNFDEENQIAIKWSLLFAEKIHLAGKRMVFDPSYKRGMTFSHVNNEEDTLPVSVIIPNYNGINYLKDCIESIYSSGDKVCEIIVVDNGSKDGSSDFLKENYPEVVLIEHSENLGFTGAVNHGILASKSPYVFLLNNDTKVEKNVISRLCEAISTESSIFSAGSLMISMDNPCLVDNAGDSMNLLGYARSFALGKDRSKFENRGIKNVFTCCAGAAMYRKSVFEEIGLFDDRHFAYLEDVDIGYRARLFGYKNINVSDSIVYHKGSAVSGSRHNEFKVNLASRNAVFVPMKNMPLIQYLLNWPFLFLGRCIKFAFFTMKGLGGSYFKGTIRGIKMSWSRDGLKRHIPFKLKNIWRYILVQMWLIRGTFLGR